MDEGLVGPHNSVGANQRATRVLLAPATRKEAGAAIARVARMGPLRAEDIPHFLGDLPPALDVRGSPPGGRLSIILPRKGADRVCMCWGSGRLAIPGDLTSERRTRTHSRDRDSTKHSRYQRLEAHFLTSTSRARPWGPIRVLPTLPLTAPLARAEIRPNMGSA